MVWFGLKIIDARTWGQLDTEEIPAWVVSFAYIFVFNVIVSQEVLWIGAIPLASYVTLFVCRLLKKSFIPALHQILLCGTYLTLWLYFIVALLYFLNIFGILLGSGGGMGSYYDSY